MTATPTTRREPAARAGGRRGAVALAGVAFLTGIGAHRALAMTSGGPEVDAVARLQPASLSATAPGPSSTAFGFPAGFVRSKRGAVASAAAFVTTGARLLDLDPLAAEKAVRQMAAASTADGQVEHALTDLRELRRTLRTGTGPIELRQASLAARVDRYDPAAARVAVWNVTVVSREGAAVPQAIWRVSTFELVWEREDWKVLSEEVAPGPAPTHSDASAPATSGELTTRLAGFEGLRSQPAEEASR